MVARSMPSSSFDGQAIGNIFHALAALGIRDDPLIDHMCTTILRSRQTIMQADDYNGQALANIAWSVAVLQLPDVTLNRWVCNMCARSIASMDSNALSQLHQYILAHEVETLVKRDRLPEFEELLKHRARIEKAWELHQRRMLSNRQRLSVAHEGKEKEGEDGGARAAAAVVAAAKDSDRAALVVASDAKLRELDAAAAGCFTSDESMVLSVDIAEDFDRGNEPVWVGEEEGGASGWLPASAAGKGARFRGGDLPGVSSKGAGADKEAQATAAGTAAKWEGHGDTDGSVQGADDESSDYSMGIGISNLQRDVMSTLSALLRGRRLVSSRDAVQMQAEEAGNGGGTRGDGEVRRVLVIEDVGEGDAEAEVKVEVTDKITGYSLDMLVQGTSLVIEVSLPFATPDPHPINNPQPLALNSQPSYTNLGKDTGILDLLHMRPLTNEFVRAIRARVLRCGAGGRALALRTGDAGPIGCDRNEAAAAPGRGVQAVLGALLAVAVGHVRHREGKRSHHLARAACQGQPCCMLCSYSACRACACPPDCRL